MNLIAQKHVNKVVRIKATMDRLEKQLRELDEDFSEREDKIIARMEKLEGVIVEREDKMSEEESIKRWDVIVDMESALDEEDDIACLIGLAQNYTQEAQECLDDFINAITE